jgi:hypothetical protein
VQTQAAERIGAERREVGKGRKSIEEKSYAQGTEEEAAGWLKLAGEGHRVGEWLFGETPRRAVIQLR